MVRRKTVLDGKTVLEQVSKQVIVSEEHLARCIGVPGGSLQGHLQEVLGELVSSETLAIRRLYPTSRTKFYCLPNSERSVREVLAKVEAEVRAALERTPVMRESELENSTSFERLLTRDVIRVMCSQEDWSLFVFPYQKASVDRGPSFANGICAAVFNETFQAVKARIVEEAASKPIFSKSHFLKSFGLTPKENGIILQHLVHLGYLVPTDNRGALEAWIYRVPSGRLLLPSGK